jgi:hypothetical protein
MLVITLLIVALSISYLILFPERKTELEDTAEFSIEAIFKAAGVGFSDELKKESDGYLALFDSQGFMALYREVYRISLDRQRYDFDRQLVAVATLLLVSHERIEPGPLQSSGKRLFLHFCRLSLLDSLFALQIARIEKNHLLFSSDSVLQELWKDYLRLVWSKVVLPDSLRAETSMDYNKVFMSLLPEFSQEFTRKKELQRAEKKDNDTEHVDYE